MLLLICVLSVILVVFIIYCRHDLCVLFTGDYVTENPYKWKIVKNTLKNGDVVYDILGCSSMVWLIKGGSSTLSEAQELVDSCRKEWDIKQGKQVVKQEIVK